MDQQKTTRFRDVYIFKTTSYSISANAEKWYVMPIKVYIKHHSELKLSNHCPEIVSNYLNILSEKDGSPDWKFAQSVDAIRILFIVII